MNNRYLSNDFIKQDIEKLKLHNNHSIYNYINLYPSKNKNDNCKEKRKEYV